MSNPSSEFDALREHEGHHVIISAVNIAGDPMALICKTCDVPVLAYEEPEMAAWNPEDEG